MWAKIWAKKEVFQTARHFPTKNVRKHNSFMNIHECD
ncbi:MAG: hypothetical protein RI895_698 [Actinomycetota bacterium]|jgi:hypothetical protein